jgi:hypothetical protein
MNIYFQDVQLFKGQSDPRVHIEHCLKQWRVAEVPSHLWVHIFFHLLGPTPKAWYIQEETIR